MLIFSIGQSTWNDLLLSFELVIISASLYYSCHKRWYISLANTFKVLPQHLIIKNKGYNIPLSRLKNDSSRNLSDTYQLKNIMTDRMSSVRSVNICQMLSLLASLSTSTFSRDLNFSDNSTPFFSATSWIILAASSVLPLWSSHLADSGIMLWCKKRQEDVTGYRTVSVNYELSVWNCAQTENGWRYMGTLMW